MGWISGRWRRTSGGQASLELALVLPLILTLVLFLAQMGLVVRDQLMVVHAAREGARAAAVDDRLDVARLAVLGSARLDPTRTQVQLVRGAVGGVDTVTVRVTYTSVTDLPLIGALVGDVSITEATTMRLEAGP